MAEVVNGPDRARAQEFYVRAFLLMRKLTEK